jgi:hypothetical protein
MVEVHHSIFVLLGWLHLHFHLLTDAQHQTRTDVQLHWCLAMGIDRCPAVGTVRWARGLVAPLRDESRLSATGAKLCDGG